MLSERLEHRGDDPRSAGAAEHENRAPVAFDDRGGHRGQWSLARCDGIGRALHQAEQIWRARLDGEIIHFIVEQEAGAGRHHAGTKVSIERISNRDGVPFTIDNRIVSCLGGFMGRNARAKRGRGCCLLGVDRRPDGGGVPGDISRAPGSGDECRVAEGGVAIDISVAHRLGEQMQRRRRAVARFRQIPAGQHVQHLAQDGAAGARRRRRQQPVAAVFAGDRRRFGHACTRRNPAPSASRHAPPRRPRPQRRSDRDRKRPGPVRRSAPGSPRGRAAPTGRRPDMACRPAQEDPRRLGIGREIRSLSPPVSRRRRRPAQSRRGPAQWPAPSRRNGRAGHAAARARSSPITVPGTPAAR